MKTQISFHNIEKSSHYGLEDTIHELARRHVERYLTRFPPDTAELHVHVEKSRHRNYYLVSAQLRVPDGTLAGRQEGYDLIAALRQSFDEIERELLRHISHLRQEDTWRRKERREELRRLKKSIDTNPNSAEAFGDLVRMLLPQLLRYVQREMAALRARGDLNPGYPTPQEVVDEVLARAYERLGDRPHDLDPLYWLYQLSHEVLRDETRKSPRAEGRAAPTDSGPPRLRDYTLDEQDQGVYELWQPDETLRPDAVAPVTEATPEGALEDEELRKYFHDALAKMPSNWRRAIWLTQAEGLAVAKAARIMGASEEEVKRWMQQGDDYLRAVLREAGYTPVGEGKTVNYFVALPAAVTTELAQALDDLTKGAK